MGARRDQHAGEPRGASRAWACLALSAGLLLFLGGCRGAPIAAPPGASGVGFSGPPPEASDDLGEPPAAEPPSPEDAPAADFPDVGPPPAAEAAGPEGAANDAADDAADDATPGDDGGADAPAAPAKDEKCPPLRVSGDVDDPPRSPWEPHEPAYYGEESGEDAAHCGPDHSRITDEYIRPDPCNVPKRPRTVLELGDPFMSPGRISRGICLPTSQVIRPRLLMYGTLRSALQAFESGGAVPTRVEWVNRLDLFFNLQLSATERVVVGMRPLNRGTNFSGYEFEPLGEFVDGVNPNITTVFFEGDIGEMFPRMSPSDFRATDIGFSVGRQPILVQGGVMINDDLDSLGVTRNSWRPTDTSNVLVSGLLAWGSINRGFMSMEDGDALLFALHNEIDTTPTFIEFDVAGIRSTDARFGDGLFVGVGATQRIGKLSTIFRVNQSVALDGTTPAMGTGTLLTSELSYTPEATDDNLYANAFLAVDQYDSVARRPESGGPLGGVGIQFASAGLGRGSAPLNPRAKDAVGGAVGCQRFFDGGRRNLILELAGRASTTGPDTGVVSGAARYQQAVGRRIVLTLMAFGGWASLTNDFAGGGRFEFLLKF